VLILLYYKFILAFIISFAVAFISTPFVKKLAVKIGAIDVPKDSRRIHKIPIPRLGGLAIFIGFLVSFFIFNTLNLQNIGFLIGATIIVIVGMIDDKKSLKAKVKLVFQILSAAIVVLCGIRIQAITNPFSQFGITSIEVYWISIVITMLWIVGVTNAVNFIDGLDGLAAGVSSIASIFLLFIALINGRFAEAILTASIAGATLGFLPFNFNPAKIFMGDTGSTFLGFSLAVISVQGTMKSYTAIAILVPLLVLGLPIFDTAFAILRRIIRRRPIMEADRGHLHHRLLDAGYTQKQSVLVLYIVSTLLGVSALMITESNYIRALIVVLTVLLFMVLGLKYLRNASAQNKQRTE
jgi:UDP-GlcNAc:undecaprenyl-phosphate GlcNAc-1-phosphate transferase